MSYIILSQGGESISLSGDMLAEIAEAVKDLSQKYVRFTVEVRDEHVTPLYSAVGVCRVS